MEFFESWFVENFCRGQGFIEFFVSLGLEVGSIVVLIFFLKIKVLVISRYNLLMKRIQKYLWRLFRLGLVGERMKDSYRFEGIRKLVEEISYIFMVMGSVGELD